jgi:two-component system chemotaxis sensor kinase CheA
LGPEERAAFCEADRIERNAKLDAFRRGEVVGISETFAVLKSGEGRFGLVLDQILGTEEIVVEALHPGLGDLAVYAGATVLGDGEIALILDSQGVCRHASLEAARIDPVLVDQKKGMEAQRILLFRSGPDEQIGLPLSALRRVVRVAPDQIEINGGREYVQLENHSVRLERLECSLAVSASTRGEECFLLLPSGEDRSWGVMASALVDSGEYSFRLEASSVDGPLVRGTALLKGRRTLILDETALRRTFARCA